MSRNGDINGGANHGVREAEVKYSREISINEAASVMS